MKKAKIMAVVLSATLVFTSSSVCFAAEGFDGEQIQAEATAELVEDITGTEDINTDIEETSDGFEVEGEGVDITLPEEGDGNIVMDSEEESIGMGLPKEVQDEEGILTNEGTVIYGATEDVSVAVQAGEEEQEDGMTFEFTRALVTIDNADAPKEYSFKFDLPEGYKLVTDKEYCEKYATEEGISYENALYVLNVDDQIVQTIDPAWAQDAAGNDVDTYYEIKGDELVQVVNFDEDTAFPVVADPTSHPAKYRSYKSFTILNTDNGMTYVTKMKNKIQKRQNSTASSLVGILNSIVGFFDCGVASIPVSIASGNYAAYLEEEEDLYEKIIEYFACRKHHYRKVVLTYHAYGTWQGKNKGYVYRPRKTSCDVY